MLKIAVVNKYSSFFKILWPVFLIFFVASCVSMQTRPYLKKDITIIAHRGASGYLPEHTLEAVALAHGFDPDFIEPDLVLTKDSRVIVLHDIHLENNTNVEEVYPARKREDGRWYAIDFTLSEIKKLNVHERTKGEKVVFKERFPLGKSAFNVPSLEEYIELIQGLNTSRGVNIGIYPEIKNPSFHRKEGKDALGIVMKVLEKYGYNKVGAPIFLQCFDPDLLKTFKKRYPNSPIRLIQLIADDSWGESSHSYQAMRTKEGLKEIAKYASGIGPWIPFILNTKLVKWAHEESLLVHPYTLRDKSHYPKLLELGVDGVFTDFPDLR